MYDVCSAVIIGAGPAALAAVKALPPSMSVAVISGDDVANTDASRVHSKIRSTTLDTGRAPGLHNGLGFVGSKSGMLASTAIKGGLTNYWGQQVVQYLRNDPWPKHIFDHYAEYLSASAKVEADFQTVGGENSIELSDGYYVSSTRLLNEDRAKACDGYSAVGSALHNYLSDRGIALLSAAVINWRYTGAHFEVDLSNGETIGAERIILAAGVVGSLRLSMRACRELVSVRLKDHSPTMLYFHRQKGWPDFERQDQYQHFNRQTLERVTADSTRMFASVYQFSKCSMSLLLAGAGLPHAFAHMRAPKIMDVFCPIQFWGPSSLIQYQIDRGAKKAHATPRQFTEDEELEAFCGFLSAKGRVIHRSRTPPGFGFHYHAGEVSLDGRDFSPLPEFLSTRFDGRVTVVDSSILPEIGVRPHTLTAMAASYQTILKHFK